MGRGLAAGMAAAVARDVVRPVILYKGEFTSGDVYLWTGLGPMSWSGQTWQGIGWIIAIGPVTENTGLKADGIVVTLSGIPGDMVGKALSEVQHGKEGTLWLGALDDAGALAADPVNFYTGRVDIVSIQKGLTAQITLTYENRVLNTAPTILRYTHEDQQLLYPGAGDKGFIYASQLQQKVLSGGAPRVGGGSPGDGGPTGGKGNGINLG